MINKKFLIEFNRLNDRQEEAVEAIEGPVMVVAGPGTGKTQIIAMRIANILRQTQTEPGNILALTFTNSGVWAMKKRLLEIIGPASYRVHVHTFHSFCNEVIQTFPELFLTSRDLNQITDLEQIRVIRQILDGQDFKFIKPFKSPYYYQSALIDSIKQLKQENIEPDDFSKLIKKELAVFEKIDDLHHDKGPNKGKIKAKYLNLKEQLQRNAELAEVYKNYQKELKSAGQYDYADMIIYVAQEFARNSELLSYFQEKFQYILVDEYQDTNSAQNEVVRLLASFYDQPNLFVVGDDEQSIFRFQGAALENILFFLEEYPTAKTIVLDQNYRSGQKILDASRALIQNNQKQIFNLLKINKLLKSTQKHSDEKISLAHFASGAAEDYFIAKTIKSLVKKHTNPQEIAVIYKEHRDGDNLAEILSKLGVPFSRNNNENVLLDLEIQKIIKFLELIANPYQDALLFEVMQFNFLKINTLDSYRLAYNASIQKKKIFTFLVDAKEKGLVNLLKIIKNSSQNFANLTFAAAFEILINESGFLKYLVKAPDAPVKLNFLKTFFDEIKNLNTKNNNLCLSDFLAILSELHENKLPINAEPMKADLRAVKILSAHQAKGLEFEHVFVIHLTDNHWGNKSARRLIKLPTGLLKNQNTEDENDEEERRLFYVALTRAKTQIYLSYADSYGQNTGAVPSKFIGELPEKLLSYIKTRPFETHVEKRLKLALLPPLWRPAKEMKSFLAQIAEKFSLSSTSFNSYLACPREFFYNQFLRIPAVKTFDLAYGSAVHFALEMFFKKQIKDFTLPEKEILIKFFKEGLKREILTPEEARRALKNGSDILAQYYDFYAGTWQKKVPLAAEYNFGYHNVHFGPIPITGKIDKLELMDKSAKRVKIIDYKTSKPKSINALTGKTQDQDFSYLYQAYFYKLLAENDPLFGWEVGEVEFEFLVPQKSRFIKVSVPIEKSEYEQFLQLVKTVYENIMALKFQEDRNSCKTRKFECKYQELCRGKDNQTNF